MGHYKANLGGVVFEEVWVAADVQSAGIIEIATGKPVAVEV